MRRGWRFRPFDRTRLAWARLHGERDHSGPLGNPLVSVALHVEACTGAQLERTLRSVLAQSHTHLELLVSGDRERTEPTVRELADPRARCIKAEAVGRCGRSAPPDLLDHARGPWIAPIELGDVFTADHLERLLLFAHRGGYEFVSAQHASDSALVLRAAWVGASGTWLYRRYLLALQRRSFSRRPGVSKFPARLRDTGVRMGFLAERVTLASPRSVAAPLAAPPDTHAVRPAPRLHLVR
jgi:hypothetical protein